MEAGERVLDTSRHYRSVQPGPRSRPPGRESGHLINQPSATHTHCLLHVQQGGEFFAFPLLRG